MAAVDGGHISGVVEEVGADGAQSTDRHDDGLKGIRQPRKSPPLRLRGRAPASPTGFKFGSTEQLPGTDRNW